MKTRLTLFLLCFVSVALVNAQNKRIAVSGNILDNETKAPIEQATVQLLALPDSSFVSGVVSLRNGSFTLPAAKAGKYVMKVSFVGYQSLFKSIQLSSAHPTLNVGKLNLTSDAILLGEAVVVAEAPQVVVVQDTTVYNASAYRVPEGSMLEDLVKKLPGAEIDDDGKVTINGKEVKKIMVDGKEFFTNDPKLALKNLPVDMIDNVKAYDKKSDLARVTGVDDGEEEAVLDLTVKKGMKKGWFGNFIGGYGNKERYEVGAMANRFTDNTQFSMLGSANNTNNQGFSEFGDAGQGLGGNAGSGINTSKSLGLNFAKDTKKLELGGNVQYGNSDRDSRMKSSTETFLKNGSSYANNKNNGRRKRDDIAADFRLEWRPDSMTNIIFRPSASYSKTRNRSNGISVTLNNEMDSVNNKSSNSNSTSDNITAKGSLQVNRRLNNKGRNITLRVNYGYNDGETDKYSYSDTYYYLAQKDSIRNQYVDNWSNGYNYKVQMSYTEPIFTNRFLQFRYSYQYKRSRSEKYTYNWDKELEEYSHLPDTASSNCYRNEYSNQQANISLRTVREKYYYNIGMSIEPQKSTSVTYVGDSIKNTLSRHVINYAPLFDFRYRFSKQSQLRIMYRGRSSQPSMTDMQPVTDNSNPLNIKVGNPSLKPSYDNMVTLFYNSYMTKTQRGLTLHASFNNTMNDVTNRIKYDETTGVKTTMPVNVNGNWNARAFFSFNTPFKNKKFTINTYTNASFRNMVGFTNAGTETVKSVTHNTNVFERLRSAYRSDIFELGLSAGIRYGVSRNSIQKQNNQETFDYNFSADTNINLPWNFFISSDIHYNIKKGYSGGFDKNVVLWNAQLSKNFMKKKQATLRFKIYDILKQQNNINRTITADYKQDTEYNTLNSYFMFHFVYRLNTFGGRKNGKGMQAPGNRSERRPGGYHGGRMTM